MLHAYCVTALGDNAPEAFSLAERQANLWGYVLIIPMVNSYYSHLSISDILKYLASDG